MLDDVAGLRTYWASWASQGQDQLPEMQWRLLLDTLGIGIEQTMTYLGRVRPDHDGFKRWLLETAGEPDPDQLARYNAWLAGAALPEATRRLVDEIDAMPPVLDAAELARWDETGVAILRQAIPPEQAAAAAALLWQQVEGDPADPESWYQRRPGGIWVHLYQSEVQSTIRRSRRIHKAFAQLWGTPDLWATTDRMSLNPPERPGFAFQGPALHWDTSLATPIPLGTQGILYLTDTAADQGALHVVPGMHRRIAAWIDALGGADPRRIDLTPETQPVAAHAGDLVIWHHALPHGPSPNRSTRPRLAQYINMYSADAVDERPWV